MKSRCSIKQALMETIGNDKMVNEVKQWRCCLIRYYQDSSKLYLHLPYSQENLSKIRKVKGAVWNKIDKRWEMKYSAEKVIELKTHFPKLEEVVSDKRVNSTIHKDFDYESYVVEMRLRGFSQSTIKNYSNHVNRYYKFCDENEFQIDEIRKYLNYLLSENQTSHSYVNQAISAIRLYLGGIKDISYESIKVPRPKTEKKLPTVTVNLLE
jgi:hypothetical protein